MADALHTPFGGPVALGTVSGSGNFTNFTLDATTDALEYIFNVPAAITVTRLGCRLGSVAATSPVYSISLQGVDASGNPDGTIKAAGNAMATFQPSALGWTAGSWNWLTLTSSYTTTRGEYLAIVITYSSGTIQTESFTQRLDNYPNTAFPYAIANNAGSRGRSQISPIIVGYGSASVAYGWPLQTTSSLNVNTGSTPDEVGLLFTIPAGWWATEQILGFECVVGLPAGTTCAFRLYDSDGTTVLQEVTHDNDLAYSTVSRRFAIWFDEVTLSSLTAGTAYRFSILPGNTSNVGVYYWDFAAAADRAAWPGGENCAYTSRTDAGAWTDLTTRRPLINLILADITEPSGISIPMSSGPSIVIGRGISGY